MIRFTTYEHTEEDIAFYGEDENIAKAINIFESKSYYDIADYETYFG